MRKFRPIFTLLTGLLLGFLLHAQERNISGIVRSADNNQPLGGVTISVKGKGRTTVTDNNGNFSISARSGDVLEASYVGFKTSTYTLRESNTVELLLSRTESVMSEVVVTAMDIKRNPRELGYSTQTVKGNELQQTQRENFVNGLQGRIAGATITPTGGMAGASSQIVLRGFNSLALDNSPLFVVDGIIVDNQTLNETSNGGAMLGLASDRANRSNDYTNRIADINPADIESVTVLKGPEATALYGSQASSGAIIITTKKGNNSGRVNVNYDNSFRVSKVVRFPEFSNKFSAGTNGTPQDILSATSGTYFGPAYGKDVETYDNVNNFFKTGFAQTHNLSADFGKKNYSFRVSGSLFDQTSPVPNNDYKRYNLRISNSTKFGKYLEIMPALSLVRSTNSKPLRGAGGYLLTLLAWPVDNDIRDWQNPDGSKKTLVQANPNSEIDNPLFNVNRIRSYDETDRLIGTMGINLTPTDWLQVNGRFGYDTYKSTGYTIFHPLSFYVTRASGGSQDNYYRNFEGYNHTITATARKSVGDFTGRILVGNMWQDYRTEQYAVTGNNIIDSINSMNQMMKDGQVITQADYERLAIGDSSVTRPSTRIRLNNARKGLPNYTVSRQMAYFGEASLSWRNMVFLTYSHRFEESSIFPKQFRNYNYPAGSISFILSDLIPAIKDKGIADYVKLRGSLASTARSSSPYANQSVFNINTGSGGGFAYGFNNNNYLLRPEKQKTYEIGTEWRFLNGRLNVDATYYNTLNTDQIVENFRASYGTGFVLNTLNVGSTRNEGVELAIDATPVQRGDFRWNIRFNFNRMWNKVLTLPSNVPEFYISDTWLYGNARGGLVVGGPTTSITGYGYQRNSAGQILIDPNTGLPLIDQNFLVRGDRNPDFTLGTINTFNYKNLSLSFLWDLKVGGDVFNGTERYLTLQGKSLRADDRKTARIIDGVLRDGLENTDNPTKNNISVIPYNDQAYYTSMPEEEFVEKDVNWFRLRDVTLNYTFPTSVLGRAKFIRSLSAFVTGNDLILITNYTGADPAVNGNTSGTRGVGAFGFDYGNIATPVSVNFGLRANF